MNKNKAALANRVTYCEVVITNQKDRSFISRIDPHEINPNLFCTMVI